MEVQCSIARLKSRIGHARITVWNPREINTLNPREKEEMKNIIDQMGIGSAVAQKLRLPITDFERIKRGSNWLYISTSSLAEKQDSILVRGVLKVGHKNLFIRKETGHLVEARPLCVLDFCVHESCQRMGHGHQLFEAMLTREKKRPHNLGYDRPSSKLLSFLKKHYRLSRYVPQTNWFVVFSAYFEEDFPCYDSNKGDLPFIEPKYGTKHALTKDASALMDTPSKKERGVLHGRRANSTPPVPVDSSEDEVQAQETADSEELSLREYRGPPTPRTRDTRSSTFTRDRDLTKVHSHSDLKAPDDSTGIEVPVVSFNDISDLHKERPEWDTRLDRVPSQPVFDKVVSRSDFDRLQKAPVDDQLFHEKTSILRTSPKTGRREGQRRVHFSRKDSPPPELRKQAVSHKYKVGYLNDPPRDALQDQDDAPSTPPWLDQEQDSDNASHHKYGFPWDSQWPINGHPIRSACFATKYAPSAGRRQGQGPGAGGAGAVTSPPAHTQRDKDFIHFPANLSTKRHIPLCETAEYKGLVGATSPSEKAPPSRTFCQRVAEPNELPASYYQLGMSGYGAAAAMGNLTKLY